MKWILPFYITQDGMTLFVIFMVIDSTIISYVTWDETTVEISGVL